MTAIGLVNDQEGFRATAAREMATRGDWILPTLRGEPYLAKPPMIYWIQLSIAQVRGAAPGLFDLRITTALAGWLGVVATYLVARRFARGVGADARGALASARWSAAGLAVGILFVRSARSGELDVLLVPWVVMAIGAIAAAWDSAVQRRTNWVAIAIAMIGAAGAALTKGPVPLGVIGITIVGAILLDAIRTTPTRAPAIIGGLLGALTIAAASGASAVSWRDAPGVIVHAILGGIVGAVLGAAASPRAARSWAPALRRCHLELVLGAGVFAIWAWGQAVKSRIGAEAVAVAAGRELEDNLRFLVPESPINNLEFLAYGLLPITTAAICAMVWCIRERPRPTRSALILLAWIVGGFILFSAAGKGVARYLTPIWPAIAMVGGIWIATGIRRWADQRGAWSRVRAVLVSTILIFGIAQGLWYAAARPAL